LFVVQCARFDGEGGWGRGIQGIFNEVGFFTAHFGGAALPRLMGDLELVEKKLEEGLLAGRIFGGNVIDFLPQALEVGGSDL
jgi:hypothetical protein